MYQKTVLNNGIRVLSCNMPHVRSASTSIFTGSGSRYEDSGQAGVSHFVEHLLFKGTNRRSTAKEIAEAIEGVGGVLNGGTDKEMTVYWTKVSKEHFGLALDVLGDMICHSKLEPAEVEKERQVIIEEINMSMDSPQQRVNLLIDEVVWPDQALGRDIAGSKESVGAITPQILRHYWEHQYCPNNTVICVAGDVIHDEVVSLVSKSFDKWDSGTPGVWIPASDDQKEACLLIEPKDTEQAHICLALRGLSNSHPDRFALDLLNVILGEGMSSRLFSKLREEQGLAYDVHSYVSHFFDSGAITVYAGTEPKNVESAIGAICNELSRFKDSDVPESEFAKAKEMVKGRLLLRMEDTRSVSGWIGSQELLKGEIKTVDEVVSIIEAITIAELRKVALDLFHPKGLNIAIVGPNSNESQIRKMLTL